MSKGQGPLTEAALAAMSDKERYSTLGNSLFPKVEALVEKGQAGFITGMILEAKGVSNAEFVAMLTTPEKLRTFVSKAVETRREQANANGGAAPSPAKPDGNLARSEDETAAKRAARAARFEADALKSPPPAPNGNGVHRTAWAGGKITHNKEEALQKFLARKAATGVPLTPQQKTALEAVRRTNAVDKAKVKREDDVATLAAKAKKARKAGAGSGSTLKAGSSSFTPKKSTLSSSASSWTPRTRSAHPPTPAAQRQAQAAVARQHSMPQAPAQAPHGAPMPVPGARPMAGPGAHPQARL